MEIVQAIVAAAEEEGAPVILQASQGALKYAGLDYIWALAKLAADTARVPVAVHLDHGTDFYQVLRCLRVGFTSVMIDGSALPLEENIVLTRRVVEVARPVDVSVEGELGRIRGSEDEVRVEEAEAFFTDPDEAAYFVRHTEVDCLAVAIGTVHGPYRSEPRLDFARLEEIAKKVEVPLVLHGASGLPEEGVREAIRLGVAKVNIDTDVRQAFMRGLASAMAANPHEIDPRKVLGPAREEMKAVIRRKIRLFGASGKA
jgi:fructose-bisphosphate aldolase class II